jgi:hypothetical protein
MIGIYGLLFGAAMAYAVSATLGIAVWITIAVLAVIRGATDFITGLRAGYADPPPEDR